MRGNGCSAGFIFPPKEFVKQHARRGCASKYGSRFFLLSCRGDVKYKSKSRSKLSFLLYMTKYKKVHMNINRLILL